MRKQEQKAKAAEAANAAATATLEELAVGGDLRVQGTQRLRGLTGDEVLRGPVGEAAESGRIQPRLHVRPFSRTLSVVEGEKEGRPHLVRGEHVHEGDGHPEG